MKKIIWLICINFPFIVQHILWLIVLNIYVIGIAYPIYQSTNAGLVEIIIILFSCLGIIYSIWNRVKQGIPIARALKYYPIFVFKYIYIYVSLLLKAIKLLLLPIFISLKESINTNFYFIYNFINKLSIRFSFFSSLKFIILSIKINLKKITLILLNIILFCFELIFELTKIIFVHIYTFFNKKSIIISTLLFYLIIIIFIPFKTFNDDFVTITDLSIRIKSIEENIEDIQLWSNKTEKLLEKRKGDINLLKNQYGKFFYNIDDSIEFPQDVKNIEDLDSDYKQFITSLDSFQADLRDINQNLSTEKKALYSLENDLSNISKELQNNCIKFKNNKSLLCDFSNIKQLQIIINDISKSFLRISKKTQSINNETIVSKKIRDQWYRKITETQSKLNIIPEELNSLFMIADSLVKEIQKETISKKNEVSMIADNMTKQKLDFEKFKNRYYNLRKNFDENYTINDLSNLNLSDQLKYINSYLNKFTILNKDSQLLVNNISELEYNINNINSHKKYQSKKLKEIIQKINNSSVPKSYKYIINIKILQLQALIEELQRSINDSENIQNNIQDFLKNLENTNKNKEINSYIEITLDELSQNANLIKRKLFFKKIIISVCLIPIIFAVALYLRFRKEKSDEDKTSNINSTIDPNKRFIKKLKIIESSSCLYITRESEINNIEKYLKDELQKYMISSIKNSNKSSNCNLQSIKIKIDMMRSSVTTIENTKSLDEGNMKVRNKLLSTINAFELQLSEVRDLNY